MIISTTPTLQTSEIIEYQGFISAEVISGVNVVKDLFAAFTDFFGGRSSKYESALIKAKNDAMDELVAKAKKMGADAIVGVELSYDVVGKGTMFMVNANGTAVKLAK